MLENGHEYDGQMFVCDLFSAHFFDSKLMQFRLSMLFKESQTRHDNLTESTVI